MTTFKLGDKVTWRSQAAGSATTKAGEVVEIVPPRKAPDTSGHFGSARTEQSYVVRVGSRFYWPRATLLRSAGDPFKSDPTTEDWEKARARLREAGVDTIADVSVQSLCDVGSGEAEGKPGQRRLARAILVLRAALLEAGR